MEQTDFDILISPESRALIERHIDDDPTRLAFKLRNPAVTSQIRILRKCRFKLPSYYAARCVVPQIAYEQASSEAAATARTEGMLCSVPDSERRAAVDLTCGLGVDTLALSRSFERVYSVEIDPLRAAIARWNFGRLDAGNIEVVTGSAEDFSAAWDAGQPIDLLYIDPSRKTADGKRVYSLEESSPDILALLPVLRRVARRIAVKLSPLFDVAEAYRLFGEDTAVEVISIDGECKEVVVKVGFAADGATPYLRATVIRRGETQRYDFDRQEAAATESTTGGKTDDARFLLVPDVAFYKTRTVAAYISKYLSSGGSSVRMAGEYLFADELPEHFAGKTYRITFRHPYQPKELARLLRSRGIRRVNIHRRNFPFSAERIGRALEVDLGGSTDIFCTVADGRPTVFFAGRID